jgi:thiol-disulfide isomerase/thioredoxin
MYKPIRNTILLLMVAAIFVPIPGEAAPPADKQPLVLVIYADWCPLCQRLKPTLALINEKYRGRIHFIRFDLTSEETTTQSEELASKLGLEKFFEQHKEVTALVVIQDASGREVFRAEHDYDPLHYEAVLDRQLQVAHR